MGFMIQGANENSFEDDEGAGPPPEIETAEEVEAVDIDSGVLWAVWQP